MQTQRRKSDPAVKSKTGLGPDLLNILRQSYDYLTMMPKLRSTFDRRLIHKTSYEGRKDSLKFNSLAKSSETVFVH